MKALMLTAVTLFVGLTLGNFLWAWLADHDWDAATERSYFQAGALGAFVILLWAAAR